MMSIVVESVSYKKNWNYY